MHVCLDFHFPHIATLRALNNGTSAGESACLAIQRVACMKSSDLCMQCFKLKSLIGLPGRSTYLLRYCAYALNLSIAEPSNRSLHLRGRRLCASVDHFRHSASHVPRHNISLSGEDMGATFISTRGSISLCHAWTRYDRPAWAACRS